MSSTCELTSSPEDSVNIRSTKRKLNHLAKTILGAAEIGRLAVESGDRIKKFKVKYGKVKEAWDRFQEFWDHLDELYVKAKDDDKFPTEADIAFYDNVSNEVEEVEVCMLESKKWDEPKPIETSAILNNTVAPRISHLPKVRIPQFDGDLLKWANFRDTFLSLVHEDQAISNVEKFNYLKDALRGEPSTLIAKMSITGDSYDLAWMAIKRQYDNPRVLASHYIQMALEYSPRLSKPSFENYQEYLIGVVEKIEAFKNLQLADSTDFLLSLIALRALDPETRREFELANLETTFPSSSSVFEYVRNRITALRLCSERSLCAPSSSMSKNVVLSKKSVPRGSSPRYNAISFQTTREHASMSSPARSRPEYPHSNSASHLKSKTNVDNTVTKELCPFCGKPHALYQCLDFNDLSRQKRVEFVRTWKGCVNCLKKGHWAKKCTSRYFCRFCGQKHHSLLHVGARPDPPEEAKCSKIEEAAQGNSKPLESTSYHTQESPVKKMKSQILLGTARLHILSQSGEMISARALLDSCSQYTFVTSELASKIGGRIRGTQMSITGLGGVSLNKPKGYLCFSIIGRQKQFDVEALVVDCVSAATPSVPVHDDVIQDIAQLDLADSQFGVPGPIDMLLGCDVFPAALTGTPSRLKFPSMYLLPTVFGLVVLGKCPIDMDILSQTFMTSSNRPELDILLEKFWKVEEPEPVRTQSPDDAFCEKQFTEEHQRDPTGRYIVRLPINPSYKVVGDNRTVATKRFLSLENRLRIDTELAEHYKQFMREYISLGHMSRAPSKSSYLIPHHAIWKGDSTKRKLRVVFDASCAVRSPPDHHLRSLNDILFSGPKLQLDIADILIRFRIHAVALVTDLVKMYRQVLVHPEERYLQHILWRENPTDPLEEFELNTLTYGVKPCAFLAIRTNRQLVADEGHAYPLAAARILSDMYVDDFVSGADDPEEALKLREEIIELFSKGGFTLDKWSSNVTSIIPHGEVSNAPLTLTEPDDHSVKILGMVWDPRNDIFTYVASKLDPVATKRKLLSAIARIFDPLGLLAPVIFLAKCLMKDLWMAKLDWDDLLPIELMDKWDHISEGWDLLSLISVPRHITHKDALRSLIGFCDASQRGTAAAVYLKSEFPSGECKIHLVKAKTKVAPTRYVSIARLELCGALLLARLITSVSIPGVNVSKSQCFTDSMVVLSWLKTPTYDLKTYEANRVSQILERISLNCWKHVKSEDNPADLASRGCTPSVLKGAEIWWTGPTWLKLPEKHWPAKNIEETNGEVGNSFGPTVQDSIKPHDYLLQVMCRFSSLRTLIHTVSRMIRFLRRVRPGNSPILPTEYAEGLSICVRISQQAFLPSIFLNGEVPSDYKNLCLFVDQRDGIVRVGGRLHNAPVPHDQRHPMFIPRKSHLSHLIIDDIHKRNYHAGPTLTLALSRTKFWVPGGLRFVKGLISRCIHCRKNRAKAVQPLMAALPKERFAQFRAFVRTGIDFAGPFLVKSSKRRSSPRNPEATDKAYLCIFICMSSRAVHLESVSALSTSAFLAALDRFCARRGTPQCLISDNGSNFLGASRFLKDLFMFLREQEQSIVEFLTPKGIEWHFNPPRSPHFGGLWEAGVKSIKTLLAGTVGSQNFTFEELSTIFIKIEGLLNSRPLCPISEDPESLDYLTPGHFLIGCPLHIIPDTPDQNNPVSRWDIVRQQVNRVWERWRTEYLHHLQQRGKWLQDDQNLKEGDLVILIEKRGITGQWPIGRISAVHPGSDTRVRVVSVRTPSGTILKRAVCNLAPLFPPKPPNEDDP